MYIYHFIYTNAYLNKYNSATNRHHLHYYIRVWCSTYGAVRMVQYVWAKGTGMSYNNNTEIVVSVSLI